MKGAKRSLTRKKAEQGSQSLKSYLKNNWQLYVMILPAVIYFFVFNYLPMYGIQIAFQNFLDCNALFFGPGKYIDSVFQWPEQRVEKTQYCQTYDSAGIMQKYSNDYLDMAPLTSEQLQANTLVETDINNAVKENMATFITEGVTDDSWNAFVSMFDGMKVADYVNVYQSAIDTMDLD